MSNRCKHDGCGERTMGRGMCSRHWQRWRYRAIALGEWDPGPSGPPVMEVPCGACGLASFAKDSARRTCAWCSTVSVYGPDGAFLRIALTDEDKRDDRLCDFEGCDRPRRGAFCQGHEKQRTRHGASGMKPLRSINQQKVRVDCEKCGKGFLGHKNSRRCSDCVRHRHAMHRARSAQ